MRKIRALACPNIASLRSATPSIPRAPFDAHWTGRFAHRIDTAVNATPLRAGSCRTRTPPFDGLALLGDPQIGGPSNETTIPDLRFNLPRVKMIRQTDAGRLKGIKCSRLGLTATTMRPRPWAPTALRCQVRY